MKRIFLIGYMGAGKTTIGRLLAAHLKLAFYDLDNFIEKRFHKTINDIFADKGEEGFRIIEKEVLREIGEYENVVISVGGGAPCFFDNSEFMNQMGQSVYLKVNLDVLAARLNIGKHSRPLLRDKSADEIREFIALSLQKREPFYNNASLIFDASEFNYKGGIENMIPQLIEKLNAQ